MPPHNEYMRCKYHTGNLYTPAITYTLRRSIAHAPDTDTSAHAPDTDTSAHAPDTDTSAHHITSPVQVDLL
jgi:hypothetical protein